MAEHSRGAGRKPAPLRLPAAGPARPPERRGTATTGRIVKLSVGQGHGFIRVGADREVYFHRSDVEEGTSFNDLSVGDAVKFELYEDAVSGARALRVTKQRPRRR